MLKKSSSETQILVTCYMTNLKQEVWDELFTTHLMMKYLMKRYYVAYIRHDTFNQYANNR
eukprot:UN14149